MVANQQELMQNIQNITHDIKGMTSSIYAGQINEGLIKLQDIINNIGIAAEGYVTAGGETDKITRLNQILSEANNAISNNDFILFADLFEYEIIIILEEILIDLKASISIG